MAIVQDNDSTGFRAVYGPPWQGVDSSAPENLIAEGATPFSDNIYIWRNELFSYPRFQQQFPQPYGDLTRIRALFSGLFRNINYTGPAPAPPVLTTPSQDRVVGAITDNALYVLHPYWRNNFTSPGADLFIDDPNWQKGADLSADILTNPYTNISFPYVISNNILYFSKGRGRIYSWDPSLWNNQTGGTLTTLVDGIGCMFMAMINEHLVCAYTNENKAPLPDPESGLHPTRIRWTPSGIFNIFDPTVNVGAGLVDLQDVADAITGIIPLGRSALIIRTNGVTEMFPLGSGINPFGFNNMWASEHGIGSIFIGTVDNWGSMGAFVSEEDIYIVTPASFKGIAGKAKQAIYADLLNKTMYDSVLGRMIPGIADGHSHFMYQLYIPDTVSGTVPILWTYSFDQDCWFRKSLVYTATGEVDRGDGVFTTGHYTFTFRLTTKPALLPLGNPAALSPNPVTPPGHVPDLNVTGIENSHRQLLIPVETTQSLLYSASPPFPEHTVVTTLRQIMTFDTTSFDDQNASTYYFRMEEVDEDKAPTVHRVRIIYRDIGGIGGGVLLRAVLDYQDETNAPRSIAGLATLQTLNDKKLKRAYVDLTATGFRFQLRLERDVSVGPIDIIKVSLLGDMGDIRA